MTVCSYSHAQGAGGFSRERDAARTFDISDEGHKAMRSSRWYLLREVRCDTKPEANIIQ